MKISQIKVGTIYVSEHNGGGWYEKGKHLYIGTPTWIMTAKDLENIPNFNSKNFDPKNFWMHWQGAIFITPDGDKQFVDFYAIDRIFEIGHEIMMSLDSFAQMTKRKANDEEIILLKKELTKARRKARKRKTQMKNSPEDKIEIKFLADYLI